MIEDPEMPEAQNTKLGCLIAVIVLFIFALLPFGIIWAWNYFSSVKLEYDFINYVLTYLVEAILIGIGVMISIGINRKKSKKSD